MQTAILPLLLAMCGQAEEVPGRPEPVHLTVEDVNFRTGERKQIHVTLPNGDPPGRDRLSNAVLEKENFDHWLYDSKEPVDPMQECQDRLEVRVRSDRREHNLTEAQKSKLLLAGQKDIKRFLELVEVRRAEFEKKRLAYGKGVAVLRSLLPLTKTFKKGPFGAGSMYAKTLEKIKRENALMTRLFGVL